MLKAHDTFRSPHIRVKEVYPLVWEDLQAVKAWKKTHVVTKREEELDGKGKMKAGEFKFFFESGKGDGASDSEPDEHEKKHSDLLLLRSQLAALKVGGRFPPTAPFPVQSNQLAQTTTSTQPPEEKPLLEADAERKMLEENGVLPHSSEATRLKARQWFEYGCYPEKHGFPPKLDDPARAAWDEQHRREHSVFVPVNKKVGGVEDEDSYDDLERGRERNKREEKVVEEKSERDEGEDAEVQRGRPRSKTVVAADIKEK